MKSRGEADDPRRRSLIKALTLGFLAIKLPFKDAFADAIFGSSPSTLPPGQSIYRISGTATVNGNEAKLGTPIGPNDTIATGKGSEIIFVVGGTSMLLRSDSQLTLRGGESDVAGVKPRVISGLRLPTGNLLAVSRNQKTEVQTSTALIGIRGTGYYLEADPEQTYFCTCYGISDISALKDPASKEIVESKHHDKPLYIRADAQSGKNIRTAPFINHTDQELMLIETLVGREVPFVFPGKEYSTPRPDY